MSDIQIILQSSQIVSSIGTATIISMALSAFLYNGYYSKIWRAAAVIAGFGLSVLIMLSGVGESGIENMTLISISMAMAFLASMLGFILGVWIYRRENKKSMIKHGISPHLDKKLMESGNNVYVDNLGRKWGLSGQK